MDTITAQKLIEIGLFSRFSLSSAELTLKDLYQTVNPQEAVAIHEALENLVEVMTGFAARTNNLEFAQLLNLLTDLSNEPVPGLTNQTQRTSLASQAQTIVDHLKEDYPDWFHTIAACPDIQARYYINNAPASSIVIEHMPGSGTKSARTAFVRQLGENLATAEFLLALAQTFGLETPYFPYDWAKIVYYAMGFHLTDAPPGLLLAREAIWDTLKDLMRGAI